MWPVTTDYDVCWNCSGAKFHYHLVWPTKSFVLSSFFAFLANWYLGSTDWEFIDIAHFNGRWSRKDFFRILSNGIDW